MANTTYSEKLKDPRWQRKRLLIFQRDNWACTACGDINSELQVHHEKYFGDPWQCPNEFLKTKCITCHKNEHPEAVEVRKEPTEPIYYNKYCGIPEVDAITDEIYALQEKIKAATDDETMYRLLSESMPLHKKKQEAREAHFKKIIDEHNRK